MAAGTPALSQQQQYQQHVLPAAALVATAGAAHAVAAVSAATEKHVFFAKRFLNVKDTSVHAWSSCCPRLQLYVLQLLKLQLAALRGPPAAAPAAAASRFIREYCGSCKDLQ